MYRSNHSYRYYVCCTFGRCLDIISLTRNKRITTIQIIPSVVSPTRKLFKSLDMDMIMFTRVVPAALIPIKSLIWDATMSIATADVNPEFTGPEMKSIKNPAIIVGRF